MTMKHYEDTSIPRRDGMARGWCGDAAPVAETTTIRTVVSCLGCLGAMGLTDGSPAQEVANAHAALDGLGVPRAMEVTAESITDRQLNELAALARERHNVMTETLAMASRQHTMGGTDGKHRATCAAAYNALPASARQLTLPERIRLLGAEQARLRAIVDGLGNRRPV